MTSLTIFSLFITTILGVSVLRKNTPVIFYISFLLIILTILFKESQKHFWVPQIIRFHGADFCVIPSDLFCYYVIQKIANKSDSFIFRNILPKIVLYYLTLFGILYWITDELITKKTDMYDIYSYILGGVFTLLLLKFFYTELISDTKNSLLHSE